MQTLSRMVTVTSDPPGAMIWKKEGTTLTCTGILTPGTVEVKFHGVNDLKKLRLRKFGYSGKNLDVKPNDERLSAFLGEPALEPFPAATDARPELRRSNAGLEREFERAFAVTPETFRCAPFELNFIRAMQDEETHALTLGVVITLDPSFGGPAFRLASHASNAQEGHQRMARAALEGGVADLFAWVHSIATRFPAVQNIIVLCMYSTTEAGLDTDYNWYTNTYRSGRYIVTVQGWLENTVVQDNPAVGSISFAMPVAQLLGNGDKKAITDAVMAAGQITFQRKAR